MRVLVLTFYYEPDLCAGSFRATAFVNTLSKKLTDKDLVDVLTTMPNRYHTYNKEAELFVKKGNVTIMRIELPNHKSGMFDQSKAFYYYAKNVLKFVRKSQYDIVFATSSRLFTAFLGAIVSRWVNARLYLDMRDIFTDTLKDVLNTKISAVVLPVLRVIEKKTIQSASKVNLVSEGFKEYFSSICANQNYTYYTNGIDDNFIDFNFNCTNMNEKAVILYAGNIGEGQGLENIVPKTAKILENEVKFLIVGAGGRKNKLDQILISNNVRNVMIINPVERQQLLEYYSRCDYLFLHLNNYSAFKKVLPSKIFEYAATGKPIIAGVSGYSKMFLLDNVTNCAVFEPCSSIDFIQKFRVLEKKYVCRIKFITKYRRKNIMDKLVDETIQLVN